MTAREFSSLSISPLSGKLLVNVNCFKLDLIQSAPLASFVPLFRRLYALMDFTIIKGRPRFIRLFFCVLWDLWLCLALCFFAPLIARVWFNYACLGVYLFIAGIFWGGKTSFIWKWIYKWAVWKKFFLEEVVQEYAILKGCKIERKLR